MLKKHLKKGFSLVELLVVITIIAILSVVAYTAVGGQTAKARNSKRQQDLSAIQSSLEIYFIENNSNYPGNLSELVPNQMPKMPTDPSSTEATTYNYGYAPNGTLNKYHIAATIENEDGTYEAYVVGNSPTPLIRDPGDTCDVIDGGSCLPYSF